MAPIKFEDNIKDKLEKRTIQPSANAWDTLANRLDAHDNKKKTPLYWWLGIAATVVGIVFVATLYFNSNEVETIVPTIVNTQENGIKEDDNQTTDNNIEKEQVVFEESKTTKQPAYKTKSSDKIKSTLPTDDAVAQAQESMTKKTMTTSVFENNINEIKNKELNFEDQKVKDAVAQIKELEKSQEVVSESEIENLLKKAEKEIISNRIHKETTKTVDANSLLQDVETDLQQSFRDKVFKALQSGYESVRTSVAERNN